MTASLARGPAICVHDAMALTGESPCWDAGRGILWWIDIQGQRLLAHAAEGQNRAIPLPLMPGFVALHDSGDLWLGLENGVWRYDPESGDLDLLAKTNADPRLRLNDGKFDRRGRLWFGTMDKSGPTGGPVGALWRLDPNGTLHKMRKNVLDPQRHLLRAARRPHLFRRYRPGADRNRDAWPRRSARPMGGALPLRGGRTS